MSGEAGAPQGWGTPLRVCAGLWRVTWRCALLPLVAVVLSSSGPARADGLSGLLAGIHAYDQGELGRAGKLLRGATRGLTVPRERALAHLYLGLCAAAVKDTRATEAAFREALAADPEVQPPRERVPPPLLALFDALRSGMRGDLRVEATELGAQVFVGALVRGTAPLTLTLPVGRHAVRVVSQDRQREFEGEVVVRPGSVVALDARLSEALGRLALSLSPVGAEVLLDGRLVARVPSPPVPVPAGSRRFVVRARGHVTRSIVLEIPPRQVARLALQLAKSPPWWKRRRPWGYIGLGLSAALLGGGLAYGASAASSIDDVKAGLASRTLGRLAYDRIASEVAAQGLRANVLLGLSAAVAAAAIVLVAWGDDERGARLVLAPVSSGPAPVGGAGLALGGRF